MRYKLLGRSGLRVSELALGTMTFGEEWGWGACKADSRRIFDAYAEAGGNFIDTANRYTEGTSERYVGDFIAADRAHFVLTTKYTLFTRRDDPNAAGNHRKNMVQSLEASLKRLQTDYVDLFWVHAWDYMTPVEEVMRGLDDLVRSGKVLYVGISDTPAWVIAQANTMADLRGWSRFVGLQTQYSLLQRTAERELFPMARSLDVGVTAWGVLGAGVLTGKYNRPDAPAPTNGRVQPGSIDDRAHQIAGEVVHMARKLDCSPAQVALAWVRQRPGVMIPVIGARTYEQVMENLDALTVVLSDDQIQRLNAISSIDMGFPNDFLGSDRLQDLVYAGTLARIDNHRNQ